MIKPQNIEEEIIVSLYKILRFGKKQFVDQQKTPSVVQLQTLLAIEKGKTTTGEIAESLFVAFPTATVILDKLVEARFVERQHDENDRRIVRLTLTKTGRNVLKQTMKQRVEKFKQLLDVLSIGDKKELRRILQILSEQLEQEESHGK